MFVQLQDTRNPRRSKSGYHRLTRTVFVVRSLWIPRQTVSEIMDEVRVLVVPRPLATLGEPKESCFSSRPHFQGAPLVVSYHPPDGCHKSRFDMQIQRPPSRKSWSQFCISFSVPVPSCLNKGSPRLLRGWMSSRSRNSPCVGSISHSQTKEWCVFSIGPQRGFTSASA